MKPQNQVLTYRKKFCKTITCIAKFVLWEGLTVRQCEQSDPRGGWGGQSEASESSFNLCQGLAVCQCEPSDPRGRGGGNL